MVLPTLRPWWKRRRYLNPKPSLTTSPMRVTRSMLIRPQPDPNPSLTSTWLTKPSRKARSSTCVRRSSIKLY